LTVAFLGCARSAAAAAEQKNNQRKDDDPSAVIAVKQIAKAVVHKHDRSFLMCGKRKVRRAHPFASPTVML
jgi:hypothetical protein